MASHTKVIVIDDDPNIHQDFMKILGEEQSNTADARIEKLHHELFSDTPLSNHAKPMHYEVDAVLQGEEGVESIRQAAKLGLPYMIAFVDVRMPSGWDGVETIKHIWEVDPDVQVVICTAYSDYSWEEITAQLGVSENLLILKKPFDPMVIRQFAITLAKRWQSIREARNQKAFLESSVKKQMQKIEIMEPTIESSSGGVMVTNQVGELLDYNESFKQMWQIPTEVLSMKSAEVIFQHIAHQVEEPKNLIGRINRMRKGKEKKEACREENQFILLKLKDGRVVEHYCQSQMFNGEAVGMSFHFRDVTHRVEMESKLQFQATHDALTQLPNRTLLYDRVKQAMTSAMRYNHKVALLFIRIGGLKEANDQFGNAIGDTLLKAVAKRLSDEMRGEDTLARYGGGEFVFVACKVESTSDIDVVANKIVGKFLAPFEIEGQSIKVSIHMGISVFPKDGDDFYQLLHNADVAMCRVRAEKGQKSYQFYRKIDD